MKRSSILAAVFVLGLAIALASCAPKDGALGEIKPPPLFAPPPCHNVHATYTSADWALTGAGQPTALEYTAGTFEGGAGNLCANCHQLRNQPPTVTAGNVEITPTRLGTPYGGGGA